MPNHVATITKFSCDNPEVLKELKELIWRVDESDEPSFDFKSVLPFPEALKDSISPVHVCTEEDKAGKHKDDPQCITLIESKLRINEYGADNWYEWNCNNWGTKWNSYHCSIVEDHETVLIIKYDTAWSPATPVLREISKRFPNVTIVSEYADEGGSFVCRDTFANDSLGCEDFGWDSEEGIKIRCNVGYGPFEEDEAENDVEKTEEISPELLGDIAALRQKLIDLEAQNSEKSI